MGQHNSSQTRVQPIFNALYHQDSLGTGWLHPLLELGNRATAIGLPDHVVALTAPPRYEFPVHPPRALLRWLLENPRILKSPPAKEWSKWSPETQQKRRALLTGDTTVQSEAITELERQRKLPLRPWWRLEGVTQVDCALITTTAIIFVEGKRIELGASKDIRWYQHRNQILRLLDCAAEYAHQTHTPHFFVLLVVDKELVAQRQIRQREIDRILAPKVIETSLPHLIEHERDALLSHYLGTTTWQDIVTRFRLSSDLLSD